jgi:hypothetical protein
MKCSSLESALASGAPFTLALSIIIGLCVVDLKPLNFFRKTAYIFMLQYSPGRVNVRAHNKGKTLRWGVEKQDNTGSKTLEKFLGTW